MLPVPVASCTHTNLAGEYRFELPVSDWVLGASALGFAPSRFGPGRMSSRLRLRADARHHIDFTLLEAGRSVTGVVRDALGGPVAGALVTIGKHPALSEPGALAHSDEDGFFELTVPMRIVMLSGYASGYFPGSDTVPVTQNHGIELVLAPETSLSGVVVWDVDSKPVADAEVFARGSGARTTTDEHGRFELSVDPSRRNLLVAAARSGHASLEVFPQPVGEHASVELRLAAGADLEIALAVGEGHELCPEGYVHFDNRLADVWGYLPVSSEPVEVRGLPLGPQSMRVGCRGTIEITHELQLVEGAQRVELVLDRAPVVTGRVLAADGSPAGITSLQIVGEHPSGDVTSVEGTFVADYLPPGIYEIEARSQRLGEGGVVTVDTREGNVDVEIRMHAWASVRGSIVDTHGTPVAGLSLSLTEQPERGSRGLATTATDGSFSFPAVRSGALGLFAGGLLIGPRAVNLDRDRVEFVHDDGVMDEFELVVESRERQIDLRIVDESGDRVPGVRLNLVRTGEAIGSSLDFLVGAQTSDLDGAIVFAGVPEGELAVRWPDGRLERLVGETNSFELVRPLEGPDGEADGPLD